MKKVFEENKLGKLTLKNRLIRSAAGSGIASKDGFVTDHVKEWYEKVAKGGSSLIISEMMTAWDDGNFPQHYLRIDQDQYIEGLKEISQIVHEEESKLIAQIGNYGSLLHWAPIKPPVGPSAVEDVISGITPQALTEEGIEKIISDFVDAARRAKEADFDGVQIHAAHGFLLNKFINPYYNRRMDDYGGDSRGRTKIIADIYKGIRQICGDDFLILLKLNSSDYVDHDYGFTFEESMNVAKLLSQVGFDGIEITSGLAGGKISPARPIDEIAYNLDHSKRIAEEITCPIILVGGIRSLDVAETILQETPIHSIAMTRALTINPNLINQWKEDEHVQSKCIGCNKCFVTEGQLCIFN